MSYKYGSSSSSKPAASQPTGITEFEILKARHRFLREEGSEGGGAESSSHDWDERLALKYYGSLYREFAVCDLKHFKSGNFSLRWRTEEEVISGTGETTCANSRCEFHHGTSKYRPIQSSSLTTLELPFGYVEHGQNKSALVKVVLCPGCVRKLMWKRRKERERDAANNGTLDEDQERAKEARNEGRSSDGNEGGGGSEDELQDLSSEQCKDRPKGRESRRHEKPHRERRRKEGKEREELQRQQRSSRSRSPKVLSRKAHET